MKQVTKLFLFLFTISSSFLSCDKDKNTLNADVIIYGGTSAAVISAVETVQSGKSVIIVCPDKHPGGLTSGGLGSYTMDSHNVQRYVTAEGDVQNEGDVGVHPGEPYKIAYGSIVPRKGECENLLVPVCLSSSHIAFGSIRMEPVFMILGQSAATAAAIAINNKISVQDVPYEELEQILLSKNQILNN